MRAIVCDIEILNNLETQKVAAYLVQKGWNQRTCIPNQVSTWTRDTFSADKLKVYLPLDPEFEDYPRRMSEIMETLEKAENRSQLDILSELITVAENIAIQGLVTHIQMDAGITGSDVIVLGVVVDKLRKIYIPRLGRSEHNLAIRAYHERLPIVCTGDLTKEGETFVLKAPRNFRLDLNE